MCQRLIISQPIENAKCGAGGAGCPIILYTRVCARAYAYTHTRIGDQTEHLPHLPLMPQRQLAPCGASPRNLHQKMGYSDSENCQTPGLRAPPGQHPPEEGPGATINRWHIEPGCSAAHTPGCPCHAPARLPGGGCARASGNCTARGSSAQHRHVAASHRPPAARPGPRHCCPRSATDQPGPPDPGGRFHCQRGATMPPA